MLSRYSGTVVAISASVAPNPWRVLQLWMTKIGSAAAAGMASPSAVGLDIGVSAPGLQEWTAVKAVMVAVSTCHCPCRDGPQSQAWRVDHRPQERKTVLDEDCSDDGGLVPASQIRSGHLYRSEHSATRHYFPLLLYLHYPTSAHAAAAPVVLVVMLSSGARVASGSG